MGCGLSIIFIRALDERTAASSAGSPEGSHVLQQTGVRHLGRRPELKRPHFSQRTREMGHPDHFISRRSGPPARDDHPDHLWRVRRYPCRSIQWNSVCGTSPFNMLDARQLLGVHCLPFEAVGLSKTQSEERAKNDNELDHCAPLKGRECNRLFTTVKNGSRLRVFEKCSNLNSFRIGTAVGSRMSKIDSSAPSNFAGQSETPVLRKTHTFGGCVSAEGCALGSQERRS